MTEQSKTEKNSLLSLITREATYREIKAALSAGADVHVRDKWGHTLLMLVVQSAHPENEAIIRLLLAAGVDPHAKDICGYTAWTYARIFGTTPEVEALLNPQEERIA